MLWNDDAWFVETKKAARAAEHSGKSQEAEKLYRALYERAIESAETETIYQARISWLHFLIFACRYSEARLEAERFLAELPEGFPDVRAAVMVRLASVSYYTNDYETVINSVQRILSAEKCPPELEAEAHNLLALAERHMAAYDKATEHFTEALLIVKRNKMPDDGAYDGNLALVYEDQSRFGEALTSYQLALAKAKKAGSAEMTVFALTGIGAVYHHIGRFDESAKVLTDALNRSEAMGNTLMSQNLHGMLADLAREQGEVAAAVDHATAALFLAQDAGIVEMEGDTRIVYGWILLERGRKEDLPDALAHADKARKIYAGLGLDFGVALATILEASVLLARGDKENASTVALEAVKLASKSGENEEFIYHAASKVFEKLGFLKQVAKMRSRATGIVHAKADRLSAADRKTYLARPRIREILA